MRGRVHSIETFSTLDGPGIRMVVFLQGCHLRCRYCHNPDTWSYSLASTSYYSSEELMALVRRGLGYYRNSGGGLTFSGGEPLLQHCFVCEVFERCHQEGIHTALDTALYVPPSRVQAVLPFTDLFIADIKHIDSAKSRWLTGQSNDLNLANIRSINAAGTQLWIRYVVVASDVYKRQALDPLCSRARVYRRGKGYHGSGRIPGPVKRSQKDRAPGLSYPGGAQVGTARPGLRFARG